MPASAYGDRQDFALMKVEAAARPALIASLLHVYPFAFCIDVDNGISALGGLFQHRCQDLLGRPVTEAFTLSKPGSESDLGDHLEKRRRRPDSIGRTELVFSHPTSNQDHPGDATSTPRCLRLAGAFLLSDVEGSIMFLGTIAPSEIRNMARHGLTVGDFGPIDPSPEFAMMAEVNAGMLADSQVMNEQLRRSRDEALAAKRELEEHREHLEELVRERTGTIERQAAELEDALIHEKRLSEMQRSFVSMASHEFRTPLAIIDGNAGRIERRFGDMSPEDVAERTRRIRNAVKRMMSLMESTLVAATVEAGKIQVDPRSIDARAILKECCDMQQELAARHRILLDMADVPDRIVADPASLTQIVTNLLSNAIKYSPDADRVDVTCFRDRDSLRISVRDFGLGIDEDDQKQIFTRFFLTKTSVGIPGTGIGLNLSQTLAEEHGGSIMISSKKGEGSTFTLRLPLMAQTGSARRDGICQEQFRQVVDDVAKQSS